MSADNYTKSKAITYDICRDGFAQQSNARLAEVAFEKAEHAMEGFLADPTVAALLFELATRVATKATEEASK